MERLLQFWEEQGIIKKETLFFIKKQKNYTRDLNKAYQYDGKLIVAGIFLRLVYESFQCGSNFGLRFHNRHKIRHSHLDRQWKTFGRPSRAQKCIFP